MKREIETKFYTIYQNNSGGYFYINEEQGVGEYVIIEACNYDEAWTKLRAIGANCGDEFWHFCECCGERWGYWSWHEDEGTSIPMIVDESVYTKSKSMLSEGCFVHYYDGKIEHVKCEEESSGDN